jgi:hypothetical protein
MPTTKPILRGKSYSIQARINGKQYWQSLGTRDPDQANDVHRLAEVAISREWRQIPLVLHVDACYFGYCCI